MRHAVLVCGHLDPHGLVACLQRQAAGPTCPGSDAFEAPGRPLFEAGEARDRELQVGVLGTQWVLFHPTRPLALPPFCPSSVTETFGGTQHGPSAFCILGGRLLAGLLFQLTPRRQIPGRIRWCLT